MIAALSSPVRRITLAIALSVLIHAAILWLPHIQFPRTRIELPPLSVRIDSTQNQDCGCTEACEG